MADSALERSKAAGTPSLRQWAQQFLRKYGWGYAFVLPSMLTFSIFTFLPVLLIVLLLFFLFRQQMKAAGRGALHRRARGRAPAASYRAARAA